MCKLTYHFSHRLFCGGDGSGAAHVEHYIHPLYLPLLLCSAPVNCQVREKQGWSDSQHVRFICGGQEMYMQDSVSRASGSVLHCIASDAAHRFTSVKQAGHKASDQQTAAVDWVSDSFCWKVFHNRHTLHLQAPILRMPKTNNTSPDVRLCSLCDVLVCAFSCVL